MQFTVFATRYLKQSTQTSYFTATGLNFNTAKPEDATQIILATQTALQQTLKTSTNPAVINDANEKLNAISEFQTAQTRLDAVDSFFRVCGITREELEAYITYLNTTQKIFENAKAATINIGRKNEFRDVSLATNYSGKNAKAASDDLAKKDSDLRKRLRNPMPSEVKEGPELEPLAESSEPSRFNLKQKLKKGPRTA